MALGKNRNGKSVHDSLMKRQSNLEQSYQSTDENKAEQTTETVVVEEEITEKEVKTEKAAVDEAKTTEEPTPVKSKKNSSSKETGTTKDFLQFTPPSKETKAKRVGLLLKPSLHAKAQKKCKEIGISFNELIGQFLEMWIDQ